MSINYYEPSQPTAEPPRKKPGLIRRFFHAIGSLITWVRNTVMNLLFLVILILIIAAISAGTPKPLPGEFALRIAPTGILVDQRSYMDPTSMLLADENAQDSETLVRDLVDAINHAAKDSRVKLAVVDAGGLVGGGISKMNEIGQAMENFKAQGKKIIAVGDNYSQDQYYLASFADEIYLHDMGALELTGYGRFISYYKAALDKLGVNVHAFRSGKYKDYLEPYLRNDMSDESREHNSQWLNSLWATFSQRVEQARHLDANALANYINNMDTELAVVGGDTAKLALENGLVDKLLSRQDMEQLLIDRVGENDEGTNYNGVDVKDYLAEVRHRPSLTADKVGLIVASGTISDGFQPDGSIGSESMVELLRQARDDDAIKTVVIRVDSGGGSAFASEIIRTEILALRNQGKPVLISMGSVAASGGYWISTAGDEIWALPTTITGSIGVFGAFPTLEKTLEKVGINTDGIGTTELAGSMRLDRPLSPKVASIVQLGVDNIYQRFVNLVAETRKMEPAAVNEIAQGHVWTGSKALELGLVDKLGTLEDVIAAAAQKAELTHYEVQVVEPPLTPKEAFLRELTQGTARLLVPETLLRKFASAQLLSDIAPLLRPLADLKAMNDPQGIYLNCLECVAP